ncbi:MAG: hypothetical protein ACTSQE_07390 [Candidatus Heimdallarchaeaceae archaeon]
MSLFQYYQEQGQSLPSVESRKSTYESSGLGAGGSYSGTAEQNIALESALRGGGGTSAPTQAPTGGQAPAPQQQNGMVGGEFQTPQGLDLSNPVKKDEYARSMGYSGWNEYQDKLREGGGSQSGSQQTQAFNIQDQYNKLLEESAVTDLQTEADTKQAEISTAREEAAKRESEVNENPFLSESSRVGRIAKINEGLNKVLNNLNAEKASLDNKLIDERNRINQQLGFSVQQYDIDRAARQENMDEFNSMLAIGAIDENNMQEIMRIAGETGLSSSFIQASIRQSKIKEVEPQVISSTDNAGNVTITTIDKNTGEVISQQGLGAIGGSKVGKSQSTSERTAALQSDMVGALEQVKNLYGHISPSDWQGAMASWIARGGTRDNFVGNFQQYADPNRGDFDQVYYSRDY